MQVLDPVLAMARADPDVVAVLLFGSAARGEPARDVDVALVLRPGREDAAGEARLRYLAAAPDGVDVQVFQALPLHVQARVLEEGRVLEAGDEDAMYEVVLASAREWEDFRPFAYAYLEGAGLA